MKFMHPIGAVSRFARARIALGPVLAACLISSATLLLGAEIELRTELRTQGGLVLLGDIAQVTSADPDEARRLSKLDVIAAPAAGQRRYLRAREVQDLLTARGVNWRNHRLSGASQIAIVGALDKPTVVKPKPSVAAAAVVTARQATEQARAALLAYVEECTARSADWQIKFELSAEQAQFVGSAGQQLVVSGGAPPWTGQQQFQFTATLDGQTRQTTVRAEVTLPPMLVVANRSLPRGALIRADDVRLQQGISLKGEDHAYQSLDEVIGKEAQRAVSEGQILDDRSIRPPLLVKRGDIVTVYARCGGVQVRTTCRAKEDGSHNDLVTVESLADRSAFFTRVIGVQEVEVYAHAVSVPGETPPPAAALQVARATAAPEPPSPRTAASPGDDRAAALLAAKASAAAAAAKAPSPASVPAPGSVLAKAAYATRGAPVKGVVAAREKKKKSTGSEAGGASDE
jgi:flagella basal body P-ring formation protein FlgA